MKRRNLKYFTLMEMLFVIGLLVILVGISWVAGTKVLRSQTKNKTKAEITLLANAIEQYKGRWGSYPTTSSDLNFAEKLSKVAPNSGWDGNRPMYIEYETQDMIVSDYNYASATSGPVTVKDPYENPYYYQYDATDDTFEVSSAGLDGIHGTDDDVSSKDL